MLSVLTLKSSIDFFFLFYNKRGIKNVEFSFKTKQKNIKNTFSGRGGLRRLMMAAVSQTCGLWILTLMRNLGPGSAAVASTCLHTNLPWVAIPHVLDGEKVSHLGVYWQKRLTVWLSVWHSKLLKVNKAHLPSLLGNPPLTDNQNLVCSDYSGQPLIHLHNTQLIR